LSFRRAGRESSLFLKDFQGELFAKSIREKICQNRPVSTKFILTSDKKFYTFMFARKLKFSGIFYRWRSSIGRAADL
jgi:hypothetical protein